MNKSMVINVLGKEEFESFIKQIESTEDLIKKINNKNFNNNTVLKILPIIDKLNYTKRIIEIKKKSMDLSKDILNFREDIIRLSEALRDLKCAIERFNCEFILINKYCNETLFCLNRLV